MITLNGDNRFDVAEGSIVRFIYNAKQRRVQVREVLDTIDGSIESRYFKGFETDTGAVKSFTISKIEGPILVLR